MAENLPVGVFFFSDVIIVARKLMKNRKYKIQLVIEIDPNFEVNQNKLEVTFKNGSKEFSVSFSDQGNASMWQQYANYCKKSLTAQEESPAEMENVM